MRLVLEIDLLLGLLAMKSGGMFLNVFQSHFFIQRDHFSKQTEFINKRKVFDDEILLQQNQEFKRIQFFDMNVQKKQPTLQVNNLCKDCNTFFACEAFNGYCSTCFRNNQSELKKQEKENEPPKLKTKILRVQFVREINGKEQIYDKKPNLQQTDKNKCFTCKKKLGLLGIQCKCSFIFCNTHRLPEEHECRFNHKQQSIKKLQSQLIKVHHQKIQQI